jgi:hypothetical protein
MKIPPIEVYTTSTKEQIKVALEYYLQSECVHEINKDESKYYVTFKTVPNTIAIECFLSQLIQGVTFTYDNIMYKAFTHYI